MSNSKNPGIEFIGTVENGRLSYAQKIAELVRRFEGKKLVIAVKEWKRRRSLNQGRFYWGPFLDVLTYAIQERIGILNALFSPHYREPTPSRAGRRPARAG